MRGHDSDTRLEVSERLTIGDKCDVVMSGNIRPCGATRTMRAAEDSWPRINALDTASGSALTLPPATGSGRVYRFMVTVTATTNSHVIKCATAADEMRGSIGVIDVDTADATLFFAAEDADNMDTITMNRTTSGLAAVGDWIEIVDLAPAVFVVSGVIRANGVVVTPFSSAV